MKSKFILQTNVANYWTDCLTFYDKNDALFYMDKLIREGLTCRLVEVFYI